MPHSDEPRPEDFGTGPYRTPAQTVQPEWLDYNDHMNVAYYIMAFDQALDQVFEEVLGVGETLVRTHRMGPMALQNHIHYLNELRLGEEFACDFRILDYDHKRVHFFAVMVALASGKEAATYESVSMNVDLDARRSVPYPEDARARIEALAAAHAGLPPHPLVGAPLGIRRKG